MASCPARSASRSVVPTPANGIEYDAWPRRVAGDSIFNEVLGVSSDPRNPPVDRRITVRHERGIEEATPAPIRNLSDKTRSDRQAQPWRVACRLIVFPHRSPTNSSIESFPISPVIVKDWPAATLPCAAERLGTAVGGRRVSPRARLAGQHAHAVVRRRAPVPWGHRVLHPDPEGTGSLAPSLRDPG